MLNNFLENHITVVEEVDSWEESIEIAAEKLLEKNYITKRYVDSMIKNINMNGPYVVIMPQVSIPHSRPEEGANHTSISLLKLNTPIKYPGGKDVTLVFVLAAENNDSHMELIGELVDLLQDKDKLEQIMESQTVEEIMNIL